MGTEVKKMNSQDFESIFTQRRSIRRFSQQEISYSYLEACVNSARLAPSGKNLQPIEYVIVTDSKIRKKLFSHLHWAGYLTPTWTPSEDEQPTAYINVVVENQDSSLIAYDVGISVAHLVLYAESKQIGSCILKNIDTKEIQNLLCIPDTHRLEAVVALGYKKEHPVLETSEDERRYWLDDTGVLHVPKRPLESIIHKETFSKKQ